VRRSSRRANIRIGLPFAGAAGLGGLLVLTQFMSLWVLSIEHGHLLSEETLKLMAEKGVWLIMQPILDDEDAIPFPDPASRTKFI